MSGFLTSLKLSQSILTRYKFSENTLVSFVDLILSYDCNRVQRSDLNDLFTILQVVPSSSYVDNTNNIYNLLLTVLTNIIGNSITDNLIIENQIRDLQCSDPLLSRLNFRKLTDSEIESVKNNIRLFTSRLYFFEHIDIVEDFISDIKRADIYSLDGKINDLCKVMREIVRRYEDLKSDFDENFMDLEDTSFVQNISDAHAVLSDPSSCLKTGMVGVNQLCGGGFKLGRGYVILGVSGEGKSGFLLNLATQIKQYNKDFKTKDPNLKPCVVYITQENSKNETIERLYNITTSNQNFTDDNIDKVINDMRGIGGLGLSDDNPINLAIIYKKPHTNNTSFFTEVIDRMKNRGYEVICILHDYVQRLNPQNPTYKDSDLRLQLGAIINEECTIAKEHNIVFITAGQLNREADSKLLDARSKGYCNLVSYIKRGQIGESLQIIQNADVILIIAREELRSNNQLYLGIHCVKNRDRGSGLEYVYQPFEGKSTIKLLEDENQRKPLFRTTMEDNVYYEHRPKMMTQGIESIENVVTGRGGIITEYNGNNGAKQRLPFDKNAIESALQRLNERKTTQIIRKEVPQYAYNCAVMGPQTQLYPNPVYTPVPWTIRLSQPNYSKVTVTTSNRTRKTTELIDPPWAIKTA